MRNIFGVIAITLIIVLVGFTELSSIMSMSDIKRATDYTELEKDEALIVRVIDGDTVIVLTSEGKEERVRLLLIDTPESVHPEEPVEKFGPESSKYAKEYLKAGDRVTLEKGNPERDKYERLLAYIWKDGVNFNLHMVKQGYAKVAYVFEPNTKYLDEFLEAQKKAKEKQMNIWSIDGYVTNEGFDMSVVED